MTTPGKVNSGDRYRVNQEAKGYSMLADDNYVIVGAHNDNSLKERILRSEYIDFARLLPKEKMSGNEGRLELVNRGGQTYFIPVGERDGPGINILHRWEQAFRVFSNIFLKEYPERATELVQ